MKLTYPTKLSFVRSQTRFSLMGLVVVALLLVSNIRAAAQGVIHLGPGDTYLLSQATFTSGQLDESGATYVVFLIGFTGDLLDPGESLQVDVLSVPTSLTPLATGIVTNLYSTSAAGGGTDWFQQPWIASWNPANGAVRLTMLTGDVDVSGAAVNKWYNFNERHYSYTIPEPGSSLLFLFSGAVLGGARWFARLKRRT